VIQIAILLLKVVFDGMCAIIVPMLLHLLEVLVRLVCVNAQHMHKTVITIFFLQPRRSSRQQIGLLLDSLVRPDPYRYLKEIFQLLSLSMCHSWPIVCFCFIYLAVFSFFSRNFFGQALGCITRLLPIVSLFELISQSEAF